MNAGEEEGGGDVGFENQIPRDFHLPSTGPLQQRVMVGGTYARLASEEVGVQRIRGLFRRPSSSFEYATNGRPAGQWTKSARLNL